MNQYLNDFTLHNFMVFVQHHWWMWLALVVIIAFLIFEELKRKVGSSNFLSPQGVVTLINHEGGVVLDLRDSAAFKAGHVVDAINICKQDLEKSIGKIEKYKGKSLILFANLESEAAAVASKLGTQGFAKVYILAGGFTAWKNASLPLIKNK